MSSLALRFYRRPDIQPDGALQQGSAWLSCFNWFGRRAAGEYQTAKTFVVL
jgi:hypothetical protein